MRTESHTNMAGASRNTSEIPTSVADSSRAPVIRARPGERVVRGGGEDRRFAPREREKLEVIGGDKGQGMWRICRDLVFSATRGWSSSTAINKEKVAKRLRTTVGTLNRMMEPGGTLMFRADHLQVLMTHADLAPIDARRRAAATLAQMWGGVFTPQGEVAVRERAAATAALRLAAAAGRTAELVHAATSPGKPGCIPDGSGGCRITPGERHEIEEAGIRAQMAAGQVVASVDG